MRLRSRVGHPRAVILHQPPVYVHHQWTNGRHLTDRQSTKANTRLLVRLWSSFTAVIGDLLVCLWSAFTAVNDDLLVHLVSIVTATNTALLVLLWSAFTAFPKLADQSVFGPWLTRMCTGHVGKIVSLQSEINCSRHWPINPSKAWIWRLYKLCVPGSLYTLPIERCLEPSSAVHT